jgi:hypothetical protein
VANSEEEETQIFRYIECELSEKGLTNPYLEILQPNSKRYSALLFQPCGYLKTGNSFIRSKNSLNDKFKTFFELAIDNKVNLAVTPEYSCPWEVVEALIKENKFPQKNNIWAIGCESITPKELKEKIKKYRKIVWIYEEDVLSEKQDGILDPLCYFFETYDSITKKCRKIIVIQFKTHHMGGPPFEPERLISGKKMYVFRNNKDSIYLITLICSDSLIFNIKKLPHYLNIKYLILHIQMNQKPFHKKFSNYRLDCYEDQEIDKREIICLNWARKSLMDDKPFNYGGSAIYTLTEKLNMEENRICENHNLGLYYAHWPVFNADIFYFNYDEYVFEFQNTKVFQTKDPAPNTKFKGPRMLNTYKFDVTNKWLPINALNEKCDLCNPCFTLGGKRYCPLDSHLTPIEKEKLIALSVGKATFQEWESPRNNEFFQVLSDDTRVVNESNNRLTFLHDPIKKSEKLKIMGNFFKFNNIIKLKDNFPPIFDDLALDCTIKYEPKSNYESHMFNLYSEAKGISACGSYIGFETEANAKKIFENISRLLWKNVDNPFGKNFFHRRVLIWFENVESKICSVAYEKNPTFTESLSDSNISILKGGELN